MKVEDMHVSYLTDDVRTSQAILQQFVFEGI